MADNAGPGGFGQRRCDGRLLPDWFELFNPNPVAVDLGGYHLNRPDIEPDEVYYSQRTPFIASHGFLLVWADENGEQNSPTNGDLHANFRFEQRRRSAGLFASDGLAPNTR